MLRTSIRHNRFSNTHLIEQILSEIESIVRRLSQEDVDFCLAESQLRVAASHLERLQEYFAYSDLDDSLQILIAQLQAQHSRSSYSFQSRAISNGE